MAAYWRPPRLSLDSRVTVATNVRFLAFQFQQARPPCQAAFERLV